jgi:RNA polymerase sigma factor (sigma-70 family)
MADDAADLMARWRQGDQQAATELFQRYTDRLIGLARSRLSSCLAQRLDPEDVVQSAMRSFFSGTREGRYQLERGGDLWQLLVSITLHKLHKKVRRNTALKRDPGREQSFEAEANGPDLVDLLLAREPSPIEAVALVDEVEQVMRRLQPGPRRMLELRLQGYNLEEIAAATQKGVTTVRRALKEIKQAFERLYRETLGPPS